LNVNPIKLLVFVAVVNDLIAAPLLFMVMLVSNDRRLMGKYVNGRSSNILGWLTLVIMACASLALFVSGGVSLSLSAKRFVEA
jgi:Mn2+/Fe2+ NRAMP family transporter